MVATSPSVTGIPLPATRSGMARKSARLLRYPDDRPMYSASPISITEPPAPWFAARIAFTTSAWVTPHDSIRSAEHTSEPPPLMRHSFAVLFLNTKKQHKETINHNDTTTQLIH